LTITLINAVGMVLTSGADVALEYDSLKELKEEKKYKIFRSKVGAIVTSALIISTLVGGYLYSLHQRLPYFLVGISTLVSALLTLKMTEPKVDTQKFDLNSYLNQIREGFGELTKNSFIRIFSLYYIFVGGITWYFLYFLNQAFATEIGFNAQERSWLFAGIYFSVAVVIFFMARSKFLTDTRTYAIFPLLITAGLIPGFWVNKSLAIMTIFLAQLAGSARFSILDQYANQEFSSKNRATANSALNMSVSFLFAVISIVAGVVIESRGAGFVMSAIGVFAALTIFPLTWVLVTRHKNSVLNTKG